jgi:hypothetical protein
VGASDARKLAKGRAVSSIAISLIVFACVFGGAMFGIVLRRSLPEHFLGTDSKDVVRTGTGLIGTMAALVLGLLLAAASSTYDVQKNELTQVSAQIVLLDRILAHYGPETKEARDLLQTAVAGALDRLWAGRQHNDRSGPAHGRNEALYDKILGLTPKDDSQRLLKSQAANLALELGRTRWLMAEQETVYISIPLLVIVVFWLVISFISFGLFAPRNGIVVTTLFLCALSVAGAIFLIMEFYSPFQGLLRLSSAPLQNALANLGR